MVQSATRWNRDQACVNRTPILIQEPLIFLFFETDCANTTYDNKVVYDNKVFRDTVAIPIGNQATDDLSLPALGRVEPPSRMISEDWLDEGIVRLSSGRPLPAQRHISRNAVNVNRC